MSATLQAQPASFTDVYQEHLPTVWRYVRSRVASSHEAEDITSEVFARALRGWHTYDSAKGSVAAWLCGIARRTVIDLWRKDLPQPVAEVGDQLTHRGSDSLPSRPEEAVLRAELLADLTRAIGALTDRERETLALRFGAGLRAGDIATVMETTAGAVRMMLSRTLAKLRTIRLAEDWVDPQELGADRLDEVVEAALAGQNGLDPAVRELMAHLAAIHRPPVPEGLDRRVEQCLACEAKGNRRGRGGGEATRAGRWLARAGIAPVAGAGWAALAPVCVGCALPVLWPVFASVGLFSLGEFFWWFHIGALGVVAPVAAVVLWLNYRRHRHRIGLVIGVPALALLAAHLVLHFTPGAGLQIDAAGSLWWEAFSRSGQLGAILLSAALMANWVALRRWIRDYAQAPLATPGNDSGPIRQV